MVGVALPSSDSYVSGMPIDSAALPNDVDALKRIIGEMARDAVATRAEIEKLRFQLARFRRAEFGQSSEKIERTVAQLELAIETLEEDDAQRVAAIPAVAEVIAAAAEQNAKPVRRALAEHLVREQIVHPGACACPRCGGVLRKIGADVTETLDHVPGRFKVIQHVRGACETVVQAPAPYFVAVSEGHAAGDHADQEATRATSVRRIAGGCGLLPIHRLPPCLCSPRRLRR
jgi:transposase